MTRWLLSIYLPKLDAGLLALPLLLRSMVAYKERPNLSYFKEGKTFFDIPWDTIVEYGIADVIATEEVALEQLKAFGSSFEELFNDPNTNTEVVA